jgi:hypothetical protein
MTAAELFGRRQQAENEIREIELRLNDYCPPLSFAEREAYKARAAELKQSIPALIAQRREQIAAENRPIVLEAETELESMRPEIERAYRVLEKASSGTDVAAAHLLLARRDQLVDAARTARIAIIDNDPAISLGGFSVDHPGRLKREGVPV